MKNVILFVAINLIAFCCFSQAQDSSSNVSNAKTSDLILVLGVGMPQGDFGDDDPSNFDAGLARPGVLLEAEYRRYINGSFFVSIVGKYQNNGADAEILADDIALQIPSNFTVEVNTTPYQTIGLMTGFGMKASLDQKTNFFTRFLIGYSSNTSPEIDSRIFETQNSANSATVIQSKGTSDALAYSISLGIDTEIDKNTKLQFGVEYLGANAEFDNINVTSTTNMGSTTTQTSFDTEIRLINISLGVAIKI